MHLAGKYNSHQHTLHMVWVWPQPEPSLIMSCRRDAVRAAQTFKCLMSFCPHRFVYVGPWLTLWVIITALLGSKAAITTLIITIALSFVPPGNVSLFV